MKIRNLLLLPLAIFAMSIAACDNASSGEENPPKVDVTGIKLDQSSITLNEGESKKLVATVTPDNATDKTVTWASNDDLIATVKDGLVTAVKKGETTITASISTYRATCKVVVNEVKKDPVITKLTISGNKATYEVGEALEIEVTALYDNGETKKLSASEYTITGFDSSAPATNQQVTVSTVDGKVTATFVVNIVAKPERVVDTISIGQKPNKLEYEIGEEFDSTGLKVYVKYTDGYEEEISGYTLAGFSSEVAGEVTITVTYQGKSASFKVKIKAATTAELVSIEVTTLPTKVKYELGESFDATGMVVTAKYSDNTTAPVTGYTISGFDSETTGFKVIVITYQEKNATFTVDVVNSSQAATLVSIKLDTSRVKKSYFIGEELSLGNLVVTAIYSDGKEIILENNQYTASGFDSTTNGEKTITITFEGKTAVFIVVVGGQTDFEINCNLANVKRNYNIGEELDLTGLQVLAIYSNGTVKEIKSGEYQVDKSAFDKTKAGDYTIIIKYEGKTDDFTVTVGEGGGEGGDPTPTKSLIGVRILVNPTKLTYLQGDTALDLTGMKLVALYDDMSTEEITTGYQTSALDASTLGKKTITITYQGFTTSFEIEVVDNSPSYDTYSAIYKLGAADMTTMKLKEEDENTYMMEGHLSLSVGDIIIFQLAKGDLRGFDQLKQEGPYANFEKGDDNFLRVTVAGNYLFHVSKTSGANSLVVETVHLVKGIQATYTDPTVYYDSYLQMSNLKVNYVYDNDTVGTENLKNQCSFYIMVNENKYTVTSSTKITTIGQLRIYVHLNDNLEDTYFDIEVIYPMFVRYTVGDHYEDVELTEVATHHVEAMIDLKENDEFRLFFYGHWTSGLKGDDYKNQEYTGDYLTPNNYTYYDSNYITKLSTANDVGYKVNKDGKYVVGVSPSNFGVIAYYANWEMIVTKASDPEHPVTLTPNVSSFGAYRYQEVELAAGDIFTFKCGDHKYGYSYVGDEFSYTALEKAANSFAANDGTNNFIVKEGCSGVYSFTLEYEKASYKHSEGMYNKEPSVTIIKEKLWSYYLTSGDDAYFGKLEEDPYDDSLVSLMNINLKANDVIHFTKYGSEDNIGYSNIADNEQQALFNEGDRNALIAKEGGAYNFYIASNGALTVEFVSEENEADFSKYSYYVYGSADFSTGTSKDGASWLDATKAYEMVESYDDLPVGVEMQYMARIKFNQNDVFKIRNNMPAKYNLERNTGALEDEYYMEEVLGTFTVKVTGTYEIYLKVNTDGTKSLYISKPLDFTVSSTKVEVVVGNNLDLDVNYVAGGDFTTLNAFVDEANPYASAVANKDLHKVTITGVAPGKTSMFVTDGRTQVMVNIKVVASEEELTPTSGYGLLFSDEETFVKAADHGEYMGYHEYQTTMVQFRTGDKFKIRDFANKVSWSSDVDGYSFAGESGSDTKWEEYIEFEDGYFKVIKNFFADVTIKLKEGGDLIYFSQRKLTLDTTEVTVEEGRTVAIYIQDRVGELQIRSTDGSKAVAEESGDYIIVQGMGIGDTTISVRDIASGDNISITVHAVEQTREIEFICEDMDAIYGLGTEVTDISLFFQGDGFSYDMEHQDDTVKQYVNNFGGGHVAITLPVSVGIDTAIFYVTVDGVTYRSNLIEINEIDGVYKYILVFDSHLGEGDKYDSLSFIPYRLTLDKDMVEILVDNSDAVIASRFEGELSISIDDEAIASAVVVGDRIVVTGLANGSTYISISDETGYETGFYVGVSGKVVTINTSGSNTLDDGAYVAVWAWIYGEDGSFYYDHNGPSEGTFEIVVPDDVDSYVIFRMAAGSDASMITAWPTDSIWAKTVDITETEAITFNATGYEGATLNYSIPD